jgi:hypothetical protein
MKTKKQSTNAPTPSLTHSPTPPSPLASYRDRVESAYAEVGRRQGEFIRSVCAFGALLDEVAAFLGAAHGGDHTSKSGLAELKDGTLQSWLAENCPEINYNTAMGYRSLAMKAARMLGGGTQAIAALQGRDTVAEPGTGDVIYVDAKVVKKRDELFEAADSRRKLEQMYFEFSRKTLARPKAALEYRQVRRSEEENAVAVIWPMVKPVLTHRGAWMKAVTLVPTAKLEEAADTIEEFLGAIRAELKRR